jgi:hypothetical protein
MAEDSTKTFYDELHRLHVNTINAHRAWQEHEANNPPDVFKPMTAERLRAQANALRKKQGLPPLP